MTYRALSIAALVIILALVSLGISTLYKPNYKLSPQAAKLVGTPDTGLVKKQLSYNAKTQTYFLNKSGINSSSSAASNSISIGSNQNAFSLKIPARLSSGVTFYDDHTGLSFAMAPQFNANLGKNYNGQLVYPQGRGNIQAVYTIKQDGLKEDIVINKSIGGSTSFTYKLNLPNDLQARMMPSGAVGIYSASPSLFGHISYGSASDQALVAKARQNSTKSNLVFTLVPPAVYDNTSGDSVGNAKLSLKGNLLAMNVSGLNGLHYPITVDPSVLVSSATSWATGNNDGDVLAGTGISEAGLTGGQLSATYTSTQALPNNTAYATSGVYNGYIYELGGTTSSGTTGLLSSVYYDTISGTGTLGGTWTPATSTPLPNYTKNASSVIYNGYIYEIGGIGGSTSSSTTYLSNVSYAPLSASGGIASQSSCPSGWTLTSGSWCSNATSLPGNTANAAVSVFNGYVYLLGGASAASTSLNSGQYAPINVDGSLGSWTSTTVLPNYTQGGTSVAYNGYLYLLGGYGGSTTGGSTFLNNVYYAPINANGSIGSWTSTTTMLQNEEDATTVVYNGYIYELGGLTAAGTYSTHTETIQINANGTLYNWVNSTFMGNAFAAVTSVVYNGYLFVLGGAYNGTPSSNTYSNPIVPTGMYLEGAATTNTYSNQALISATSVVYAGYVFEIGGNLTGNLEKNVSSVAINANGTLGTWATTTSLPNYTELATTVVYNGYIYEIGGFGGSSSSPASDAYLSAVYSAPISTGGAIGTWSTATSLPTATDGAASVASNGYIYEIGGSTGTNSSLENVSYAAVGTSGGLGTQSCPAGWTLSASTWCSNSTSLPNYTAFASGVTSNGYIYEIGGFGGSTSSSTNTLNSVYYDSINSNGSLGSTWTSATSLPVYLEDAATTFYNGYIYEIGGFGGATNTSNTAQPYSYYALINANGSLGSWNSGGPLQSALGNATAVAANGFVYFIAGSFGITGSSAADTVYYSIINNGGPGTFSSWTTNGTTLPATVDNASSVVYKGDIYELGLGGSNNNVYWAPINADGSVGSWTSTTNLPQGAYSATAAIYNGYVYYLGGTNGSSSYATVAYASLSSSGGLNTLGSCPSGWTLSGSSWCYNSTSLPNAVSGASTVVNNDYIYELGDTSNLDYYAPINADGSVGSWTSTTNLPQTLSAASSVVYNGYIYEIGGINSSTVQSTVYEVPINSNGSLGTWAATTPLPLALENATAVASNGFIYELGGTTGSAVQTATYVAPIYANGSIGTWNTTVGLTQSIDSASSVVYNGDIYELGGFHTANLNTVYYATLQSIPHVGAYSILVDITGLSTNNPTPVELVSNGTNSNNPGLGGLSGPGGIMVQYAFATNACTTLNTPNILSNGINDQLGTPSMFSFTTNGCSTATNLARYAWIRYTLDDSETATFPDAASNHTSITNLTLYYHPASGYRLRGGATFTNGSEQSLDAPP